MPIAPDPSAGDNLMSSTTGSITGPTSVQTITNQGNIATADNAAVSPVAPLIDKDVQVINLGGTNRNGSIHTNPFDNYIDVTYGLSLAMVSRSAVNTIAGQPVNATPSAGPDAAGITSSDYQVFASTAESKYNRSGSQEYYNIQGLSYTSFLGHLPQNPMTAVIWDAKMQLFEPHGFALREDIEVMRKNLGYENEVEPLNYVYRMEIWFSGWDPQNGSWTQNIPFALNDDVTLTSIVYYLVITTIEAAVTAKGTEYSISMQAMPHKTMRAESLIYRMQGNSVIPQRGQSLQGGSEIQYGRGSASPTFGDFVANLEKSLHDQVMEDTHSGSFPGLNITYRVTGPSWLMNEEFDSTGKITIAHGGVDYNSDSGTYVYSSQDVDLLTFLYNVMDHLKIVRTLLSRQDDLEFLQPSCLWNIRSNITPQTANNKINGYDSYIFDYYIEPVLSYRSRTTVPDDRNKRVETQNQQQRVANMKQYGMIVRQYDFFFTNDNTEIISLDFKYRNFYQEPYPSGVGTVRGEYNQGRDPNVQTEEANRLAQQVVTPPTIQFGSAATAQSLSSVLGQAANPQSAVSVDQLPAWKHQGMVRQGTPSQSTASEVGTAQADMAIYTYAKQQYFRYDMIDVNMTVRFDPTWLLNPYMAGGDFTPRLPTSGSSGSSVFYMHIDRVVFIKAFAPVQNDFMNPNRTAGASGQNDHLSGFYQVLTALSEFSGGKFTQKLNMFKYPHLNGYAQLDEATSPSIQNPYSLPVGPDQALPTQQQPTTLSADPNAGGLF